jgi:hypothetical protein
MRGAVEKKIRILVPKTGYGAMEAIYTGLHETVDKKNLRDHPFFNTGPIIP